MQSTDDLILSRMAQAAEKAQQEQPSEPKEPKEPVSEVKEPEAPAAESSLKTTETKSEETPTPKQTSEQSSEPSQEDDVLNLESDEDYAKVLSEHFGREITVEQLSRLTEEPTNPYANDVVKEINEWVSKGGDLNSYMQVKTANYDSMEDIDVVKISYQQKYPNLTERQLELKIKKDFPVNDEYADEDDLELAKANLTIAASEARNELNRQKQSLVASLDSQTANQTPQISEEDLNSFYGAVNENLKSHQALKVGDFTYEVNDKIISKVEQSPVDISERYTQGENFDFDKYNQERIFLENREDIIKAAIEHGKSLAIKDTKERRNNPSYEPSNESNVDTSIDLKEARKNMAKLIKGEGMMKI